MAQTKTEAAAGPGSRLRSLIYRHIYCFYRNCFTPRNDHPPA